MAAKIRLTHGMYGTSIYICWANMLQRCENLKNPNYHNYGGRGIKVCDRWHSFENFYKDMGELPIGKSLDRWPDNDGNYKLGNCRWATREEQNSNCRPISCGPFAQKWFRAWHKDSMAQYISNNQHKFAKKWDLCRSGISQCLNDVRNSHKGWHFERLIR